VSEIKTSGKTETLARDERGSVLMETVIVIPLFIVLIGGTFWLGDLILAKQKLVVADRYAAWNAGNRHRGGTGGIQGKIKDNLFKGNISLSLEFFILLRIPREIFHKNLYHIVCLLSTAKRDHVLAK